MNKQVILYVIDDLARGGAETLLIGLLPEISEKYDIILVSLTAKCEFEETEIVCKKRYSLNYGSKWSYFSCVLQLRKIIQLHKPVLVHAHLLNSSIIGRMACPSSIPFVHTLHSILSNTAFNDSWMYRYMEKLLFRKYHYVVAVSEEVLKDYENTIAVPSKKFVLPNYVADKFLFSSKPLLRFEKSSTLKLVAVGNIKKVKNYEYLIDVFTKIINDDISLDIYGRVEDEYGEMIRNKIRFLHPGIQLKGPTSCVEEVLPQYHFFVMPSQHEGFGIAAVEAMAIGLPLLLSDIKVLKDITYGNALFFDLNNPQSFLDIIESIKEEKISTDELVMNGQNIAKNFYSKSSYVAKLLGFYDSFIHA